MQTRKLTELDYILDLTELDNKTIQQDIEELENLEAVLAIEKIISLEKEFPGIVQVRMLDHIDILADSARKGKYPLNNWLEPNGFKSDRTTNYESIQRHIDQARLEGKSSKDKDSGRSPELHAACRLMMSHTRTAKNIVHELDLKEGK